MILYVLKFFLLFSQPQTCNSTIFGYEGDRHAGGNALALGRPVRPGDYGIAHRRWKMGTRILIKNLRTGKKAFGEVIDRGPYGAIDSEGNWFLKSPGSIDRDKPGRFRGCADLTPDLAKAIGHDGFDRVRVWRVK